MFQRVDEGDAHQTNPKNGAEPLAPRRIFLT
jgi:hypothetical protein